MKLPAPLRSLSTPLPHALIAALMLMAMLAAWTLRYLFSDRRSAEIVLLSVALVAVVPLAVELVRQVARGSFSVDFLAFLSVASAVVLHQYLVAAIVILMLSGGKALEEYATRRASSVLGALARRMPHTAHRQSADGAVSDVPAETVRVGDRLMLYPHELCPVDGQVVQGSGTMDESYLTGEPFLIAKAPGTQVLSGAINGDSLLVIEASKLAVDSRYANIVAILHSSEQNRPRIRRLGDRLGLWYTPLAVAAALLSWLWSQQPERFLAVLVIATPCPLLLAIPVAIIGAISVAARNGIVIKDPSILEKLQSCRTLIVDKTGTLTYGRPQLTEITQSGPWPRRTLLQFAASLERYSRHPLGSAVLRAAADEAIPLLDARDVSEPPGTGLTGHLEGHQVMLTGRNRLPAPIAAQLPPLATGLECVVMIDGECCGLLRFRDEPRHDTRPFLHHLQSRHGVGGVVLLSGDRPSEVAHFAAGVGIAEAYGGKSPEEKLALVRQITARTPSLYLGDGINDAPAMLNATAGIAFGVSSEITSEAAGAVILQSSLSTVDELIHIGGRMRRIALTSAVGGMALSAAGMAAGAFGYLTPVEGAILQELIDLVSILNSLRMILPSGRIGDFSPAESSEPGVGTKEMLRQKAAV